VSAGYSSITACRRLSWLPASLLCLYSCAGPPPLTSDQQQALALRFAPLIKTTLDGERHIEPYAPNNWDWFASRSTLVDDYKSHTCAAGQGTDDDWPDGTPLIDFGAPNATANVNKDLLTQTCADIRVSSCFTPAGSRPGYALHMDNPPDHAGESWSAVIDQGHGIYAHIEEVPGGSIVNIEYTIVWAYNGAPCDHHEADITTVVVDYDMQNDALVRISYSVHGYALEEFDVSHPSQLNLFYLHALDRFQFDSDYLAAQVAFVPPHIHQKGGTYYNPSAPYLYLVRDATSHRFEHPVVFAEYGGHELWPNNMNGSVTDANAHTGDGIQFIPATVQVLGTVANPVEASSPLVYLNGLFGSDSAALALHNSWFWPAGRPSYIPQTPHTSQNRFTDGDPYSTTVGLGWPPAPAQAPQTVYVSADTAYGFAWYGRTMLDNLSTFDGSQAHPFPEPDLADTFVAPGGTIQVKAGAYKGWFIPNDPNGNTGAAFTFTRACTINAVGGPVTLGGS
jgi:hypothetical protein